MKVVWREVWVFFFNLVSGCAGYARAFKRTGDVTDKYVAQFENGVDLDLVESSHLLDVRRAELNAKLGLA